MTPAFSVAELLAQGARQNQQEVCVSGWVWDRFEHRAIYDSLLTAPDPKISICVTGQLANRPTSRGDGPLHGQRVQLIGVFHWQPKKGAGHFGLWPAWLGVKSVEHTNTIHASVGSGRCASAGRRVRADQHYIHLCNQALEAVRLVIPASLHANVYNCVNQDDEWGVGMEALVDGLIDLELRIAIDQFVAIETAMASIGLADSKRIRYLREHNVLG